MEVIAKIDSETYVCRVNHEELEKFLSQYYGKLEKLNVGSVIDLAAGYDHHTKICDAVSQVKSFVGNLENVIDCLKSGLKISSRNVVKKSGRQ